jgi:hypothetical protein
MGEVPVALARSTGTGVFKGFRGEPRFEQLDAGHAGQIEMQTAIHGPHGRGREAPRDIGANFVATGADTGAEGHVRRAHGHAGGGAESVQGGAGESRSRATPAGVRDSDGARNGVQQAHAVGGCDSEGDAAREGQQGVAPGLVPGARDSTNVTPVDLTSGDEVRGIEAVSFEQAAAVLDHGLGAVSAGEPKVEGVPGRSAHAALAGRKGKHAGRVCGGGSPGGHGRGAIEGPRHKSAR